MRARRTAQILVGLVCVLIYSTSLALDVTIDSGGSGSTTLTDTDLDGVIDFDVTLGGVFHAKGRVLETLQPIVQTVTLTSTPPETEALFTKLGVGAGTAAFTVTVNTTAFPATGTPLGWTVAYVGNAGDAMAGPVDIPSHSVSASVNAGVVPLTTITGAPITMPTAIDLFASGVNPSDSATDVRVVFTFVPGPDDEIRLPDNNGFDDKSIEVNVFNQSHKCIDRMNNGARKVADAAQKSDAKCVKRGTGNVTACVDDPNESKTATKESRLLSDFVTFCDPVPAWGVNGASCCEGGSNEGSLCALPAACPGGTCVDGACISGAAEAGASAITHDVFGPTVTVDSAKAVKNCQKTVIQQAGKLHVAHWKAFRKCKKDMFAVITGDADLVSMCLGPPQNDPRGTITKALIRLNDKVQKKCVSKGVSPVGAEFPGECTAASDIDFGPCVADRVACRFCRAANLADAIVPPLDCDTFDDGVSNASCP